VPDATPASHAPRDQFFKERAHNLWQSVVRKQAALERSTEFEAVASLSFDQIGGLAEPKEEILTYACAATNPDVYGKWGTYPPSAMLLIGRNGVGKSLLARALATRTETSFLRVAIPKLVLEVVHHGGKAGDLLEAWDQALQDLPRTTVLFDELEFSQAQEIGARRPDLPVGPIMDFLLELLDRTIGSQNALVIGATSHPATLRPAFVAPRRFERVIEVNPIYPDDVIEALGIHARDAEKRAGRPLFEAIDWKKVVGTYREPSVGDWVRVLHAVLRRKARCDAAGEPVSLVTTDNLLEEVERAKKAAFQLPGSGVYL
jgi:ATP-dependent 26S proteasome regulatory subunit